MPVLARNAVLSITSLTEMLAPHDPNATQCSVNFTICCTERSRVKIRELQELLELARSDFERLGGDCSELEEEPADGRVADIRCGPVLSKHGEMCLLFRNLLLDLYHNSPFKGTCALYMYGKSTVMCKITPPLVFVHKHMCE